MGKHMKKENTMQDYIRFIFSFLVIAIHYPPFDGQAWNSFFLLYCRIAVPFYIIISGFYFSPEQMGKWMKKIFLMYFAWEIVYLPLSIMKYSSCAQATSNSNAIAKAVFDFVFKGNYYHLWYFIALMQSAFFVWIVLSKFRLSHRLSLILACILYIFGYVFNVFNTISFNIPVIGPAMHLYVNAFESTYYSGIFMGLIYFLIGYLVREGTIKLSISMSFIMTILGIVLLPIEETISQSLCPHGQMEISLSLVLAVVGLFGISNHHIGLPKAGQKIKFPRILRKISTIIFGVHCWIGFFVNYLYGHGANELKYYLICILSIVAAIAIFCVSNTKQGKPLRVLY